MKRTAWEYVPMVVEVLEEKVVLSTFTVQGQMKWTDVARGTHGIPMAYLEVYDANTLERIGTGTTSLAGNYTISATDDLVDTPDIFVRTYARSTVADIKPTGGTAKTYFMDSQDRLNVADGSTQTINVTGGNVNFNEKVFSVHNSLIVAAQYMGNLTGVIPSTIDVRYDASVAGSYFDGSTSPPSAFIRGTGGFEWDEILHEFGHYVANRFAFDNSPGGSHTFGQNLANTLGRNKDRGNLVSWSEGFATYFGISAQVLTGASSLNIPEVGDNLYQAYNDGLVENLETNTGLSGVGLGEDDERSVMSTLWDLMDGNADGLDTVAYGDKVLFDLMKSSASDTIAKFWEAMAAGKSNLDIANIGAVFGQNKIAPEITGPADNAPFSTTPLTFTWNKNGGGTPNPLNSFRVTFYNTDMSEVVFQKDVGNVNTWTPTNEEWGQIQAGGSQVKYVVEGKNTTATQTPNGGLGYYWSGAQTLGTGPSIIFVIDDTGSMGEEIGSVVTALQQFIDFIDAASETSPVIQLITFKDDVTVRVTSDNLDDIRSAVGALYASGGGDCPEFSAQALAVAADNIAAGGTILLATDASTQPGVDIGSLVSKLLAKSVSVNVLLSGDCEGIRSTTNGPGSDNGSPTGPDGTCGCNPPVPMVFTTTTSSTTTPTSSGTGAILSAPNPDGTDDHNTGGQTITDPGQAPIDDYPDTAAEAFTPLTPNGSPILGRIGDSGDLDYFTVHLEAGKTYNFYADVSNYGYEYGTLYGTDGTTALTGYYLGYGTYYTISYTPDITGTYYFAVSNYSVGETYTLHVTEGSSGGGSTSSEEVFSTIAGETGGSFLVHDEVKSGDSTPYIAAMFNVMASSVAPAVISANPDSVPQGETVAVTLTGGETNWVQGKTSVSFSNPDLVVKSITVTSSNTLTLILDVGSSVPLDFYDVTVTTILGDKTEVANGDSVLEVSDPVTSPTLLSASPDRVDIGSSGTLTLYGANTTWNNSVTVTLGTGITVNSVQALSGTQLAVTYTVDPGTSIGFRTATVDDAGEFVSLDRAFFVGAAGLGIAEIQTIVASGGHVGETLSVTITGSNTNFEDGVTTANFGAGITVNSVTVNSATSATVNITIDADADLGFRDVSLTTGDEVAVLNSGFLVESPLTPGNINVRVENGALIVEGDNGDNTITIIAGKKSFQIIAANGTTINGSAGPLTIAAKKIGRINMGSGTDKVVIKNPGAKKIKAKGVSVNLGAGNDTLRVEHYTLVSKNTVVLGAGNDTVELLDTVFSTLTTIDLNQGEDTLTNL